ncbi:selenocysteine-specific translation elongation factor [Zhaonella formicivorans]|uniref:selenocysteine-specific translation elongation factor n=1 Tax=Zhaonella formicivorans TaxID=2528593 RepID=UPI001D126007|nr:selenocysteine-specific translation elongation factor [Zhaonella formicivorans]
MDYVIVGTAGHVDHGKTELVKALTGINTDRLKEERERGISIELGFAPLQFSNGQRVGLVDVPGHEKFIKQMLAGVGGMDLVMLVVAADEGVMPQTQEHLDIIDLLQIKKGIIVITKSDLVDADWLELVREEVREAVRGTVLEEAPMIAVSALTGHGIPELKSLLQEMVAKTPPKSLAGKVRLPIDRVFSITGFGTVVTGTLWSGKVKLGETLQILPEGLQTRVRSLQVHGQQVEEALAGQRVAINLAGIEVSEIARGSVVVSPGALFPSHRIDAELHLLQHATELENRDRVRVHVGTSEVLGRVVLLDREKLQPGETAFVQLQLENVLVSAKGDRFVIRSYSPMHTIGGGVIIEPKAERHKRFNRQVLDMLATKLQGTPEELILEALNAGEPAFLTREALAEKTNLPLPSVDETAEALKAAQKVTEIAAEGSCWLAARLRYEDIVEQVRQMLGEYHQRHPLRPGLPKEELRSRKFSQWGAKLFNALLQTWTETGFLRVDGNYIALQSFTPTPDEAEQRLLSQIERHFLDNKFQPAEWSELTGRLKLNEETAGELLRYLLWKGILYKINEELYFHRVALEEAKDLIASYIKEHGSVQLGEVRDLLNSSRKYVLPLLEYFDQIKFTKRVQDKRILF